MIDILSGTSAGGINAVFPGESVGDTLQGPRNTAADVLNTADMDKSLNRGGVFQPKRSLLNENWMYQQLYKAFRDMNNACLCDKSDGYNPVEPMDLFVTTTDLNGVSVPIRLADMDAPEKIHKGVFNFRCNNIKLTRGTATPEFDVNLDLLRHSDFQQDFDAMLAFASRCTSSFPSLSLP